MLRTLEPLKSTWLPHGVSRVCSTCLQGQDGAYRGPHFFPRLELTQPGQKTSGNLQEIFCALGQVPVQHPGAAALTQGRRGAALGSSCGVPSRRDPGELNEGLGPVAVLLSPLCWVGDAVHTTGRISPDLLHAWKGSGLLGAGLAPSADVNIHLRKITKNPNMG